MTGLMQEFRQEAGFAMRSPLLFEYIKSLSDEGRYEFLDILPASQGVIDFFTGLSCKLNLPGCSRGLYELDRQKLDTPQKLASAIARQVGLRKKNPAKLNLVLLWDLPNFLHRDILSGLVEYLLPHSRQDILLHTYIYTKRLMPALPGHFNFTSDDRIWFENEHEVTRKCPVYYQESLQKLMYPFVVRRSILLSNGLQEYTLALPHR